MKLKNGTRKALLVFCLVGALIGVLVFREVVTSPCFLLPGELAAFYYRGDNGPINSAMLKRFQSTLEQEGGEVRVTISLGAGEENWYGGTFTRQGDIVNHNNGIYIPDRELTVSEAVTALTVVLSRPMDLESNTDVFISSTWYEGELLHDEIWHYTYYPFMGNRFTTYVLRVGDKPANYTGTYFRLGDASSGDVYFVEKWREPDEWYYERNEPLDCS